MTRKPTPDEAKAIASLKRLAKTWPQTIMLVSMGGSLHVMAKGPRLENFGLDQELILEDIHGIPNDGGDW